jgi:DNA-binding NtrC family response regulator
MSDEIISALEQDISLAAASDLRVLITGGDGAVMTLIACLIHQRSQRACEPFIVADAAEIGTSPTRVRQSLTDNVAKASNGTLLIQRIDESPAVVRDTLLRAIETTKSTNARLITTARHDLFDRVRAGQFPHELYYRLNLFHLRLESVL